MKTASWLLLNAKDKLFNDFILKYYPHNSADWFNCRKLRSTAIQEAAAYKAWRSIVAQKAELNPVAYKSIDNFETEYVATEVYKNSKTALFLYSNIILLKAG
jgi:hypothetical protein